MNFPSGLNPQYLMSQEFPSCDIPVQGIPREPVPGRYVWVDFDRELYSESMNFLADCLLGLKTLNSIPRRLCETVVRLLDDASYIPAVSDFKIVTVARVLPQPIGIYTPPVDLPEEDDKSAPEDHLASKFVPEEDLPKSLEDEEKALKKDLISRDSPYHQATLEEHESMISKLEAESDTRAIAFQVLGKQYRRWQGLINNISNKQIPRSWTRQGLEDPRCEALVKRILQLSPLWPGKHKIKLNTSKWKKLNQQWQRKFRRVRRKG